MNEERTEEKLLHRKITYGRRCRSAWAYYAPSFERVRGTRKNCKLFFFFIILLYSLARASISMANNSDKPHKSSHSICSLRKWATRIPEKKREIGLNQRNFCSNTAHGAIMFLFFGKNVFFIRSSRHPRVMDERNCTYQLPFMRNCSNFYLFHSLNS